MSDLQRTYKPVWQRDIKVETRVREMHTPVQLDYKTFVALPRFTPGRRVRRAPGQLLEMSEAVARRKNSFALLNSAPCRPLQ